MRRAFLPHDIYGAVFWPWPLYVWIMIIVVGLSVLVFVGWLWWVIQNKRKVPTKKEPIDQLQQAVQKITELELRENLSHEAVRQLCTLLSRYLREFWECYSGISATDMTVEELEKCLPKDCTMEGINESHLIAVLRRCDEVKFAGATLEKEEAGELLAKAKQMTHNILWERQRKRDQMVVS